MTIFVEEVYEVITGALAWKVKLKEAISHGSTGRSCTGAINARQIDQSPVLSVVLINCIGVVKLEMFFQEPDSCFLLNSIKHQATAL